MQYKKLFLNIYYIKYKHLILLILDMFGGLNER